MCSLIEGGEGSRFLGLIWLVLKWGSLVSWFWDLGFDFLLKDWSFEYFGFLGFLFFYVFCKVVLKIEKENGSKIGFFRLVGKR